MKKIYCLFILLAMVVIVAGFASASMVISGVVFDAYSSEPISGTSIDATCNGVVETTTSLDDGSYSIIFDDCQLGSDVSVHAFKYNFEEFIMGNSIQESYPEEYWNIYLTPLAPTITTRIYGTIYQDTITNPISGANVIVTCDIHIGTTTSNNDGSYSVTLDGNTCSNGNLLTVYAEKDGLTGIAEGTINDSVELNLNLATVNVPLVPEFGVIVGIVTAMGALGMFFVVRRK
jgi:hypothetical protein